MPDSTRREFFGKAGFVAMGFGAASLHADVLPTEASGDEDIPMPFEPTLQDPQERKLKVTERDIEGPYFRVGAPYRAKVTPPLAKGKVTLIRGRVWGFDTKKPLPGACIHVWQANHEGRYDNHDPKKPPRKDVFLYRARMLTDEAGRHEFESIHPGRYLNGDTYRPAHIHYRVEAEGYETLIIAPKTIQLDKDRAYRMGVFDIVLKKK